MYSARSRPRVVQLMTKTRANAIGYVSRGQMGLGKDCPDLTHLVLGLIFSLMWERCWKWVGSGLGWGCV